MGLIDTAMTYYPYVFHPITVLGVGFLVLLYYEWDLQGQARAVLWRRVAVFLAAGLLALVPTVSYFLASGSGVVRATRGNAWRMDALVGSGLLIVAGICWYAWRRFDWGALVPGAMAALAAATIPYVALSSFWNVSGHVIVSLLPTLYLTLVDRRFWPTLSIPAIMVPNRIFLDAHTWPQTLWAVPYTALIVVVAYWYAVDGPVLQDRIVPEASARRDGGK